MFALAIDGKLRGCDIGDVAVDGSVRSRATVVRQKTGRSGECLFRSSL